MRAPIEYAFCPCASQPLRATITANGGPMAKLRLTYQTITNPRNYILYWVDSKQQTIAKIKANTAVLADLRLDYRDDHSGFVAAERMRNPGTRAPKPLANSLLEDALAVYIRDEAVAELTRIVKTHSHDKIAANKDLLSQYVTALTGAKNELDCVVLAHWLWTVKRRANGLSTVFELMPILVGKQGGGKSQAVRQLLRSWTGAVINLKLDDLSDQRMFEAYSTNYIAFADELEGADRADMNALKNQITTETNSFRALYTHDVKTVPMLCSFIGASNRKINEVFNDNTGMRRFFEITCQDKLDWEVLNNLDYLSLWRSIDESLERGYLTNDMQELLAVAQAELTNKSDVEEFFTEHAVLAPSIEYVPMTADNLYRQYRDWAADAGMQKPATKPWFIRRAIAAKLGTYIEKQSNGAPKRYFKINPESTLVGKTLTSSAVLEFKK